jgi:hypothetical protein
VESESLFTEWTQCWSKLGDLDEPIQLAQDDLNGMNAQQISEGILATVVINQNHYRGALDAVRFLTASICCFTHSFWFAETCFEQTEKLMTVLVAEHSTSTRNRK